jgi:uncharacterized membrane-anchored protein YjiN (DUF445 family)
VDPKLKELRHAKRRALLLLAAAAGVFALTLALPANRWLLALRAVAEASMVGGLADWFAVAALFRRIPTGIPFITSHTDVIANSKDRIAGNLAVFVKEKFLDPESLVTLIRNNNPSRYVARWLTAEANTRRVAGYLASAIEGVLQLVEDARVEQLLRNAVREVFAGIDLTRSLAGVLDTLTAEGRHARLLEQAIDRALALLERAETREWIARQVVDWLKEEHPVKARALPNEWIGRNAAQVIAEAVGRRLETIRRDPVHLLRAQFDALVHDFVQRLQADPALQQQGERIKQYILDDATFGNYVGGLWGSIKQWLAADLRSPGSALHQGLVSGAAWLGRQLAQDDELRAALNGHMEEAARSMAPGFAEFLTVHIRDTIRQWNARDLAGQIELNIGKELQAIRVNGTLVGGAIGLVLHLLTYLPALVT